MEPIPITVVRYRCTSCPRTHSGRAGARKHIARCWYRVANHGCKTCKHFEQATDDDGIPGPAEWCAAGVDLSGSDTCPTCGDLGWDPPARGWPKPACPTCNGTGGVDGPPRKAGPIIGCPLWELHPDILYVGDPAATA